MWFSYDVNPPSTAEEMGEKVVSVYSNDDTLRLILGGLSQREKEETKLNM